MQSRKRRNFAEAARAFEKLQQEVSDGSPAADGSRRRLELLAYLGALLLEFQAALDVYREGLKASDRGPSPPWLLPDAPMAGLREYRRLLATREGEVLAAGSGPGCELVDACDDMAWFLDKYLYAEILAESTAAPALPVESLVDLIDEKAREQMPEARRDRTLARFREFAADDSSDIAEIWRLTKDVARRRERINGLLDESKDGYVSAARAVVPRLAEGAPWALDDVAESARLLSKLETMEDPENRLRMKRFCTVQIVLETIAGWATKIRDAVADEDAESGGDVAVGAASR